MRTTVIAMLHQGHPSATKMDQLATAFWWPGINQEIREKAENCPSCRASGMNLVTQLPSTEKYKLENLSELNQEVQLDFAGPIKLKTRGNVYILIDRFSKWPTAQICKNTDSRTVLNCLTKYCSDNGTPRSIRTDNGSCFKSNEFKELCNRDNIKRIRCTPNLHTGTGQVERTIRTNKSLTRANMADGLTFEESVILAIKTIRQTPHSKLNLAPFQMHFGRKPRTAINNLIGQPECLLSNWKKTLTNYISAQRTELQMFTINDSEGEMTDYIVLNDSKKKARSVSPEFKQYQFFEKEKPNALKCRFKTNKMLTAIKETKHTITTSEGKTIHKRLASKPVKFQLSRKPEEKRRCQHTNKCRRCGKVCQGEFCDKHRKVYGIPEGQQEPCSSQTLPMMPQKRSTYGDTVTTRTETDVQEPQTVITTTQQHEEQDAAVEKTQPEENVSPEVSTPLLTTPIQCSTSHGPCSLQKDEDQTTPIRTTVTAEILAETVKATKEKGKVDIREIKQKGDKVTFEQPNDLRRPGWDRILLK